MTTPGPGFQSHLAHRLEQAKAQSQTPLSRSDVAEIISEIIGTMEGDVSGIDLKIYQELESLANYIQSARSEIAQIRPDEIQADYIPTATDELDAVVGATEEATGRILDSAEQIQTIAAKLPEEPANQLMNISTEIFEASNFQDITGQRITKVVNTLKHIEAKIDVLVNVLGEEVAKARPGGEGTSANAAPSAADDSALLNGPQLPDTAVDQDEIDRLLQSFD